MPEDFGLAFGSGDMERGDMVGRMRDNTSKPACTM